MNVLVTLYLRSGNKLSTVFEDEDSARDFMRRWAQQVTTAGRACADTFAVEMSQVEAIGIEPISPDPAKELAKLQIEWTKQLIEQNRSADGWKGL